MATEQDAEASSQSAEEPCSPLQDSRGRVPCEELTAAATWEIEKSLRKVKQQLALVTGNQVLTFDEMHRRTSDLMRLVEEAARGENVDR